MYSWFCICNRNGNKLKCVYFGFLLHKKIIFKLAVNQEALLKFILC